MDITPITRKRDVFCRFASDLANLSYCKRLKVGCIILPEDFTEVFSIGYNGPPRGVRNDSCTGLTGDCGCIHAEANAIAKLMRRDKSILITTHSPCKQCAGLILNTPSIRTVMYAHAYRDETPLMMLASAGVNVVPM